MAIAVCYIPRLTGPMARIVGLVQSSRGQASRGCPHSVRSNLPPRTNQDPGVLPIPQGAIQESATGRSGPLRSTQPVAVTPWWCSMVKELLSCAVDQGWAGECLAWMPVSSRGLFNSASGCWGPNTIWPFLEQRRPKRIHLPL